MIIKKSDFCKPNYPWRLKEIYPKAEIGDIIIEIPDIDFDAIEYATLKEVGKTLHEEEGVRIGNIEITSVLCKCTGPEPIKYWFEENMISDTKQYLFEISIYVYDDTDWLTKTLKTDDLQFIVSVIIPYLNIFINNGIKVSEFNWEWIEDQCSCSNYNCKCQNVRMLHFYDNDILSAEDLYDKLEYLKISGHKDGINHVGKDNDFWDVITVELNLNFPFVDRYLGELLFDNPIYDENKSIKYTYCKNVQRAYAPVRTSRLSDSQLEEYKKELIRSLRIYKVHNYDKIKMIERRFLKS